MQLPGDDLHHHLRVERGDCRGGGAGLVAAQVRVAVGDLPLQVAQLHHVAVGQQQAPHPRGSQVEGDRAAQPPQPDHQHAGRKQPLLPRHVEIVEQDLAVVTQQLTVIQHASSPH